MKDIYEKKAGYVKELRSLLEAEVNEAEIIIAVKGIGKSIQEMTEKIGRLQNEDLPPLSDQVRETYGVNTASQFQQSTSQALQSVMEALHSAKESVDQTVLTMAGEGDDSMVDTDMDAPMDDGMGDELGGDELGMDDGMGDDLGLGDEMGGDDLGLGDEMGDLEGGDEFGAEEPLGRAAKESVQSKKRKIAEMQKMIAKAKRLKERA